MLGIFQPQNKTARPIGSLAMNGLGAMGLMGLGQYPSTCPTKAISPASAQKYVNCRAVAYSAAVKDCATYPGNKIECINPNFYESFNRLNCNQYCAEKCTAEFPIRVAQEELKRPVTGKWTWLDQVALEESGKPFIYFAPGCTGEAPKATQPPPTPTPQIQQVTETTPTLLPAKKGMSTANMMMVGGALAAVAVGGYYVAKKKGWIK